MNTQTKIHLNNFLTQNTRCTGNNVLCKEIYNKRERLYKKFSTNDTSPVSTHICKVYKSSQTGILIFKPAILCMTGFIQLDLMMNVAKDYCTNLYAVDNGGLGSS